MACVKTAAAAALTIAMFLSSGCSLSSGRHAASRRTIAAYSFWDGMGPPSTDPQFPKFACVGTFTISNLDVTFAPGTAAGCASPMHQRTVGTLAYSDLREIRVTRRPELLIFSKNAAPPALRVTDWVGAADFQRAVTDLQTAYQRWSRADHSTSRR
jgi:hypothetical protein